MTGTIAQSETSGTPTPVGTVTPGDVGAFIAAITRYDRPLRALAFHLLKDQDAMDDALQDAYEKAFRGLSGRRGTASIDTWLYRIVYTTCIDLLRQRRRLVPLPNDQLPVPGGAVDTSDIVIGQSTLMTALHGLAPDQAAAVLLVDWLGCDYRTAAEVVGVPPGTIGSRLSHARSSLRRALGAHADDDRREVGP